MKISIFNFSLSGKTYYCGGHKDHEEKTIIKPTSKTPTTFLKVLEFYRPKKYLSFEKSVTLVEDVTILQKFFKGPFFFKVEPLGRIEAHDFNWKLELIKLLKNNVDSLHDEVKEVCINYWNGVSHHKQKDKMEYFTPTAKVLSSHRLLG